MNFVNPPKPPPTRITLNCTKGNGNEKQKPNDIRPAIEVMQKISDPQTNLAEPPAKLFKKIDATEIMNLQKRSTKYTIFRGAKLDNKIVKEPDTFIDTLSYLIYGCEDDGILQHLHLFIDSEFYNWFIEMNINSKKYQEIKESFVNLVYDLEYEKIKLLNSNYSTFINDYKSIIKDDEKSLKFTESFPKLVYFTEKIKLYALIYPRLDKNLVYEMIISQYDKLDYLTYKKYLNDINLLLYYLKYEDEKQLVNK